MQQLNRFRSRKGPGVWLGIGLLLALAPLPGKAQTGDSSAPANPAGKQAAQEELPAILLIEHRPNSTPAHRNDPNLSVQTALQAILTDSNKFTVWTYSPYLTLLKTGILRHELDASDLDEPIKPASIHRIASVLGARSILIFYTVSEKDGIRTDVSYEELVAQQTWRTVLSNQFHTGPSVGKRRLKPEEMAQVNADTIAKSLNIPSHLLDNLHLEVALKPLPAANTKKPKKSAPNFDAAPVTPDGQQNPGGAAITDNSAPPTTDSGQPTVPEHIEDFPEVGGNGKKSAGKNRGPSKQDITSFPQTGGGIDSPGTPVQGQVISEQNITNIDRATRYKQSGDPVSAILYLRRAIDDAPNDLDLRRQLIQAYQDNQMPDMAVAEIERALLLDPKNGALYRFYGDSLYSLGKSPDALKAYQEAVRLDPNDVAAQIALGDILLHSGQLNDALKTYHAAAAGAPKSALPHRRMARVALQNAYADPSQYNVSLEEIKKARSLSLPSDTATYLSDYALLLHILQSRLLDLVDQMDAVYTAYHPGTSNKEQTLRQISDLKERASAAADYLDALPTATGQEGTQALYQEGAVSVITTLGYFKSFVEQQDAHFEDKMNSEKLNARHDLNTAGQRLQASLPDTGTNTGEHPSP